MTTPSSQRYPTGRRTTVAALLVVVAGVLPIHLTGALAPDIQRDLGFGDRTLGFIVSGLFCLSSLITVAGGNFTDRSPQRALRTGAVFSMVGIVAMGLAPSLWLFVVAMLITAPGNAISQPGANVLIAEGVAVSRRGVALGIKQSAIAVSTTTAGVASLVLASSTSWRWVYGVGVVIGLSAIVMIPDVRRPNSARVAGDRPAPAPDSASLTVEAAEAAEAATQALGRQDQSVVRFASIAGFCGSAAVSSIGTFLVRAAEDSGLATSTGRILLTAGSILLLGLRIVFGWLADRGTISAAPTAWRLLLAGTFGYLAFSTGTLPGFIVGAALTFGAGWSWPGLLFLAVVRRFPDAAGRPSARVQRGMFMGAVLGPALFGFVADAVSFQAAWWISALWGLGAALAVSRVAAVEI